MKIFGAALVVLICSLIAPAGAAEPNLGDEKYPSQINFLCHWASAQNSSSEFPVSINGYPYSRTSLGEIEGFFVEMEKQVDDYVVKLFLQRGDMVYASAVDVRSQPLALSVGGENESPALSVSCRNIP